MFVYKKRVWAKQCIFVRGKFNKSSLVSVSLWDHARSVSRAGTRTIINLATEDEVRSGHGEAGAVISITG